MPDLLDRARRTLDDAPRLIDDLTDTAASAVQDVTGVVRDTASELRRAVDETPATIEAARKVAGDAPRLLREAREGSSPVAPHDHRRLVVGTLLAGIAAGGAAMLLLDPERGRSRRAALVQRGGAALREARRILGARLRWSADRARGIAIERGVAAPPSDDADRTERVPIPVGPGLARTDAAATLAAVEAREPVAAGTIAAEGHMPEDRAASDAGAGDGGSERGEWHRDL